MHKRYSILLAVLVSTSYGCSASSSASGDGPHDGGDLTGDSGRDGAIGTGDGGLDGGACAPAPLTGFTPRPFVPAPLHQGACTSAEIAAYISACGSNAIGTSCSDWLAANVDPDAGTVCGNCVYPTLPDGGGSTAGANYEDPSNLVAYPNYATCLAVEDPAHGTACGTAIDALNDCEAFACVNACLGDPQDFLSCTALADEGDCATYFSAQASDCAYDPIYATGAVGNCYAGGGDNQDVAQTFIDTLICGSADALPDGGPSDAGPASDAGSACQGPGSAYPFPACFTAKCAAQIQACEQDCSCQTTLADCFANLFDAQGCVGDLALGDAGLATSASACIYPMLVDYPTNCP